MKISIHNYLAEQQEIINIPDDTEDEEIETELSKLGYSLSNIEYMVLPNGSYFSKCKEEDMSHLMNMERYYVEFENENLDFNAFKIGTDTINAEPLSKVLKDKYNLYMYVYAYSEEQVRDMLGDYKILDIHSTE